MFWDIAQRSPYVNRRFGGTYHHLQGRKSTEQETSMQQVPRQIHNLDDGSDMFLSNVASHASHTDYTALYPTRWQYSSIPEALCYIYQYLEMSLRTMYLNRSLSFLRTPFNTQCLILEIINSPKNVSFRT
jgi:hypothetical protein